MTREEAIGVLQLANEAERSIKGDSIYSVALGMAIKALEQETEWTLCSERPPEEDGEYYVTAYDNDNISDKYLDIAGFEDGEWQYRDSIKVLAWMPLPALFEPKENEEV